MTLYRYLLKPFICLESRNAPPTWLSTSLNFQLTKTVLNDIILESVGLGIHAAFLWELYQDFFGVTLISKGS